MALAMACIAAAPGPMPSGVVQNQNTGDLEKIAKTEPSKRSEQRLKLGGLIDEVIVKPGDKVTKGQLLMKLDMRVEELDAKAYKTVFDSSNIDIDVAVTKNKQAKNEFARWDKLFNEDHAASIQEYEKSKLDVELTEQEIKKARAERDKNEAQYNRAMGVLKAMELRAAFDGIVESIDAKIKEVIDYQKPAITIVCNDPLWIEFLPKSEISLTLRKDQELNVWYLNEQTPRKAKIIFMSPVVDAQSDRQLVRLEMGNPEGKPAGLQVRIELPTKLTERTDAKGQ